MGTEAPVNRVGIVDALFTVSQRRVLGLIFGQPNRSFYAREIIESAQVGSGSVQRLLKKLEASGLVIVSRSGVQKHYRANADSPVFSDLASLFRKTTGLVEPISKALAPCEDEIELAVVYGSAASGAATAQSDIDLLIVTDTLTPESLYARLDQAETLLGRPIHVTQYTSEEFNRRRQEGNAFLGKILERDTLPVIGEMADESQSPR
jgi:predicted nucleotidyltransferase